MRKIKFRAWDKKEMIYNIKAIQFPIKDDVSAKEIVVYDVSEKPFRNIVLLQCTGLKDKNGKEIYEGDIIKHPYKGIREVYYDDYERGFAVEGTYLNRMAAGEVIGNIYSNPELTGNAGKDN